MDGQDSISWIIHVIKKSLELDRFQLLSEKGKILRYFFLNIFPLVQQFREYF
jgi:hypothetical protein